MIPKKMPLFLPIVLVSCSTHQHQSPPPSLVAVVHDFTVKPGEVTKMAFEDSEDFQRTQLFCKDRRIPFYRQDGKAIAFLAESYFSDFKDSTCRIGEKTVANIIVAKKSFPEEKLNVPRKMVFPSKKDRARIKREQEFLNKNYASSGDIPLFDSPFRIPLDTLVTSIYGARRLFNDRKKTQHLGTDFRARIGQRITSSNSGRVVVARDLYYTGGTITIDHGLGIFTIYGHLSKLLVKEGQSVDRGQLIGYAGSTGRTTGPHLHWGVKVNGHFVEGSSLVRESQK